MTSSKHAALTVRARWDHYVGGEFVPPAGGRYTPEFDPRTSSPICEIAVGEAEDIDRAVQSASAPQTSWAALKPMQRGRVLTRIAEVLRQHLDELAEIDRMETGRPLPIARGEIELSAQYFEYYGAVVHALGGKVIDLGANYHSYTRDEPFGTVGIILPWNGPLNQAARGIAPALAAGNAVVAKPSELTSVSLLRAAELAVTAAGLPAGLLNVVTGPGSTGAALVSHSGIRKIAFTGSVAVGREIGRIAAERIIPVGLELGGKSPNIVFSDADLDLAVPSSLKAFTFNSGQVCSAGTRCLVQRDIHDEFVQRLQAAMQQLVIGGDELNSLGPIITRAQYERVQKWHESLQSEGVRVVTADRAGGQPAGWHVAPVICTGVDNTMRIAREEIFGPVLAVIPFDTEEEAIAIANDSDYGLVAGLWTRDISRAHRVAARIEAGQIYVNEYFAGGVETPFGGYKNSGHGREKGVEALKHYSQVKCVTIKL